MAEGTVVGTNIPPDTQPLNQWDWFKLSRTWVTGAEERLQRQVEGIQNAIKWFFGLGSSATILGVLWKEPRLNGNSIWWFATALLCLLVAYGLSTVSSTMVSRVIQTPNDPDSIRREFNRLVVRSRRYLVFASSLLLIGMFLFPVAIVASIKNTSAVRGQSGASFSAVGHIKTEKNTKYLYSIDISGYTPDSSTLVLRLEKGSSFSNSAVQTTIRHCLNHSMFDYTIQLPTAISIDSTAGYYLSLIYKMGTDSLNCRTSKLLLQP